MHTAYDIGSEMFAIHVNDHEATPRALLDWESRDRLGVVVNAPLGGLGAGLLTMVSITAFYDEPTRKRRTRPLYPDIYLFQVAARPSRSRPIQSVAIESKFPSAIKPHAPIPRVLRRKPILCSLAPMSMLPIPTTAASAPATSPAVACDAWNCDARYSAMHLVGLLHFSLLTPYRLAPAKCIAVRTGRQSRRNPASAPH